MTNTTKCIYIQKSQPPQTHHLHAENSQTHALCPNVTIYADPHMLQHKQSFWQALLLIWLGKHFHPNPVVTDRCFWIEVLFWTHINHQKGRHETTTHRGHHMSQCTRQTPQTLFYSNEQLWMPFSYSDGIDTDVGFADNTNASTGRTYHSRSFNTGSTDIKKLSKQRRMYREHSKTGLFEKNHDTLVHYNWEFDTHNNVQSKICKTWRLI